MTAQVKTLTLSHGTLQIRELASSMRFYHDFLGMEAIQHLPYGCRISLNTNYYLVCLESKNVQEMPLLNHFGFDVGSKEEVDQWYQKAMDGREEFGIKKITRPSSDHGFYQFYLQDTDCNWWEIQAYEGNPQEDYLHRGIA